MQRDVGYTIGLTWVYGLMYLVLLANTVLIMLYGLAVGTLLVDPHTERLTTFHWYWVYGQSLGFAAPIATLWLMYHTWYDIFYWFHMIVVVCSALLPILYAVMVLVDKVFTTCTLFLCDGSSLAGMANEGTKPDWSLWLYTGMVAAFFIFDCIYVLFNFYLHRRTEFRVMAEFVAAGRAPPLSRAYMNQAQYGGFRMFYDAFAPPGQHSLAFDPATGEPSQIFSRIGHRLDSATRQRIGGTIAALDADLRSLLVMPGQQVMAGHLLEHSPADEASGGDLTPRLDALKRGGGGSAPVYIPLGYPVPQLQ